jgi:hypothetical protein
MHSTNIDVGDRGFALANAKQKERAGARRKTSSKKRKGRAQKKKREFLLPPKTGNPVPEPKATRLGGKARAFSKMYIK